MKRLSTTYAPIGLLGMVLGLAGCERGCLSSWFRAQGIDQAASTLGGTGGPLVPPDAPCPSGLARCSGGVVRVSRSFTPPTPCSPEGCTCPWDDAKTCELGCAFEAIEVDMPRATAVRQLCAPAPGASYAHPPTGSEPSPPGRGDAAADAGDDVEDADVEDDDVLCDVERFRCAKGVVLACQGGAHAIGVCNDGCADGEHMILAATSDVIALSILCKR